MNLFKQRSGWWWAGVILGAVMTLQLSLIAILAEGATVVGFLAALAIFYALISWELVSMRYLWKRFGGKR